MRVEGKLARFSFKVEKLKLLELNLALRFWGVFVFDIIQKFVYKFDDKLHTYIDRFFYYLFHEY